MLCSYSSSGTQPLDRGFRERMSPFYSSEWLSRLKPHIKHDIYRQGSVESAPFMWDGERLQGWAFKAMSLNCILAKWDEWCFLIRLLTGLCVVKVQRWCRIAKMLDDMLLVQASQLRQYSNAFWHHANTCSVISSCVCCCILNIVLSRCTMTLSWSLSATCLLGLST